MNSISDTDRYKNICRLAYIDDFYFNTFKSNQIYNEILEHVSYEGGKLYLDYLNHNFPQFISILDKFKLNDKYGGSKLSHYDGIGNISPSTLRYIKVLSDLNSLFGDLSGKRIIEIGVGYGGQCFVINQLFDVKDYFLIDLDDTLLLSNKYLSKLNTNHQLIKIEEVTNVIGDFDLVVSNYAYSELTTDLQDLYWEKIISKSKHGYFTLNFISDFYNIKSYSKDELFVKFSSKNPKIMDEIPNTFENNIIMYF
jgi:putative sugar O-methyltransferase